MSIFDLFRVHKSVVPKFKGSLTIESDCDDDQWNSQLSAGLWHGDPAPEFMIFSEEDGYANKNLPPEEILQRTDLTMLMADEPVKALSYKDLEGTIIIHVLSLVTYTHRYFTSACENEWYSCHEYPCIYSDGDIRVIRDESFEMLKIGTFTLGELDDMRAENQSRMLFGTHDQYLDSLAEAGIERPD